MSDGPTKIVPKAEPLDEMILGEDELPSGPRPDAPRVIPETRSYSAPPPPIAKPSQPPPMRSKPPERPSTPPYFPPPAVGATTTASVPPRRSSQRIKAADAVDGSDRDSQARKRAKVTLRIPDDEVARPSSTRTPAAAPADEITIPLVRTMTGPPPRTEGAPSPPLPPVGRSFNPDDTLEMPEEELRAHSHAALSNEPAAQPMLAAPVAAGVDASTEKGWTPSSPKPVAVAPSNEGVIQPTPIVNVRGSTSLPPVAPLPPKAAPQESVPNIPITLPSSDEIPVAVDLGLAHDEGTERTSPRLPMDSEEIKIDETGEHKTLSETGELEIDAGDMLSVDSLPAPPPVKTAGKYTPYKSEIPVQQQSASQLIANATSQPPPAQSAVPTAAPSNPVIVNAPEPVRDPNVAARRASSPSLSSLGGLAPPPMTDTAANRKKTRPWWEELFNDDFIRTMAKVTDAQINAEATFIEESLGCESGAMVLDLACGTGRHAVELAARGYQVVGFDLSLAMLARASDEAQDRKQKINFVQGDMREMTFEETFDGVFSWNTSFGYFDEVQNSAVIARVHKSLKKGGQFLLDVVNRDYIVRQAPSLAWFEGDGCICMDEMTIDFITSRMKVKRTLMMDDGRTKEIEYSIRVYSLHELGKMLHDNGFRVAEVSGRTGTPGVFFGCEAPRTLILAEKR